MPSPASDAFQQSRFACDYCGLQGFRSYDAAKHHEVECSRKRQRSPPQYSNAVEPIADMEDTVLKRRQMTLMGPEEGHHLEATDAVACRNIEIFEARSMEAHGPVEHVGLRCLHCSRNSMDGDIDASAYPSSVASMGTSVRMMTDRHLAVCQLAPGHVREMARAAASKRRAEHGERRRPSQEDERNTMALREYCYQFCRNVGIVEKYPPRTGLVFGDDNLRSHENVHHTRAIDAPLSINRTLVEHSQHMAHYTSSARLPILAPFPNDVVAATPLVRRSKAGAPEPLGLFGEGEKSGTYAAFRPQRPTSGQQGIYSGQRSSSGHEPPESSLQSTPHPTNHTSHSISSHQTPHSQGESSYSHGSYELSHGFPYWQDGHGAWTCKYCMHFPPQYREHGYLWHPAGNAPPPTHYIDQHLSVCRGYQMPPQPYYQGHSQSHYGGYPPSTTTPYGNQYPSAPQGPTGWDSGNRGMSHAHNFSSPQDETPYHYSHDPPSASIDIHPHLEGEPDSRVDSPVMTGHSRTQRHGGSQHSATVSTPPEANHAAIKQAIGLLTTSHSSRQCSLGLADGSDELVLGEDKLLLTEYFYHLMKQLRVCRFSEADRKTRGGKRENITIGYGGLQCIHCADASNSRKFFWSNVDRLANSFAEIPGHVLKCRRCPMEIKTALHELKRVHPEQMAKLPRGSQKVFFRRMWRRLHDEDPEGAQGPGLSKGQHEDDKLEAREDFAIDTDHSEQVANSPGTVSSEDSPIVGERSTDECAKALGDSLACPPSPNSRILLAIVEDTEWLSDMDCFIRRNLEVFCATDHDVDIASSDRKYPVTPGQVGIRCVHCARAKEVTCGNAVAYPYSISGIYESVREFQRLHMDACPNLPSSAKTKLAGFKGSSSLSSVLRKYYVLAAKALGMIDTSEGIRSGGEAVPLGNSAAFVFKDKTVTSEKMGDISSESSFLDSAMTPLESRKRKPNDDEPGSSSSKKQNREAQGTVEEEHFEASLK